VPVEAKVVREHIGPAFYYLEVHLLFASIVCIAAWILTSVRTCSATSKYWIWVATSLNFIVPVGGFFDEFGAVHVSWATQLRVLGDVGVVVSRNLSLGAAVLGVWIFGTALMLTRLLVRIRADERAASAVAAAAGASAVAPALLAHGVPVKFIAACQGPSVDGVLRPRISLPHGIERMLSEEELDAVLLHEATHARRRDNLIRLIHEIGLCVLWFHPLLWLTGSRLALYRELSCDESVIKQARGVDLISAMAKLAAPEDAPLLRANAASFMSYRVAQLSAIAPQSAHLAASVWPAVVFGAVLLASVLGTVAHTPSCFPVRF
jgi:beta-lactamase regulating signal transducer with metallopeptidase domain